MPARTTSTTKALSDWFARIAQHKDFSGKDLVTYDLLPTLEDIEGCHMKSPVIRNV